MTVNIHIETLNITPDALGEVVQHAQKLGLVEKPGSELPGSLEPEDARIERLASVSAEDEVAITRRNNFLRNVISHASPARGLEGFQTNHYRKPHTPKGVDVKQSRERTMAEQSLEQACGSCVLRSTCVIDGNLDTWLDYHPYARDKKLNRGKRRPGSSPVPVVEARDKFSIRLSEDKLAHCVPKKETRPKK